MKTAPAVQRATVLAFVIALLAGSVALASAAFSSPNPTASPTVTSVASPTISPTSDPTPSPTPSTSATGLPSSVTLDVAPGPTGQTYSSFQLTANLSPSAAYGSVSLWDGSKLVAAVPDYRLRWSWATDDMSVGVHNLTVDFEPDAASGYAPSTASYLYTVEGPQGGTTTALPSKAPSAPKHKAKDPQPISVTIPKTTVLPTRASKTPTSPSHPSGGGGGTPPMTGFDALMALLAAAGFLLSGLFAVWLGHRSNRPLA